MIETPNDRSRRLRATVAKNYAAIVVVALLVGAVGGYLTYTTHVDPGTTTETRQPSSWQSSGEFTHRATVVNGTTALDEGAVLRNRTTYFSSVTPRLNGTFSYGYTASDGGNVHVETTIALVFQSVERADEGNGTVYWQYERSLARASADTVGPGERTSVPFSVNVSEATAEVRRVDGEFGGTPGELRTVVVARTELSGTRNGQPVDVTRTYHLPISPDGSVYRVVDPGPVTESGGQTDTVAVPVEYGPVRAVGGPLVLLLGASVAAGVITARRAGHLAVTDYEREWLVYRRSRAEFDEWITTGRMAAETAAPTVVTVDSLEGLVDVAIDTDNRVIEDEGRGGVYLVLTGDRWYRYDAPTDPSTGGLDPLSAADGENHDRFESGGGTDSVED